MSHQVPPALPASKLIQGVKEQYRKGKLEAIKWYRAVTGVSLMEAKQIVERIVPDVLPQHKKGKNGMKQPKQRTKVRLRHRVAPGKK